MHSNNTNLITLIGLWHSILKVDEPWKISDAIDLFHIFIWTFDQKYVIFLLQWKADIEITFFPSLSVSGTLFFEDSRVMSLTSIKAPCRRATVGYLIKSFAKIDFQSQLRS